MASKGDEGWAPGVAQLLNKTNGLPIIFKLYRSMNCAEVA